MEFSKCGVRTETVWRDMEVEEGQWLLASQRLHVSLMYLLDVQCTLYFFIALWASHSATITCCYFFAMNWPHNVPGSW